MFMPPRPPSLKGHSTVGEAPLFYPSLLSGQRLSEGFRSPQMEGFGHIILALPRLPVSTAGPRVHAGVSPLHHLPTCLKVEFCLSCGLCLAGLRVQRFHTRFCWVVSRDLDVFQHCAPVPNHNPCTMEEQCCTLPRKEKARLVIDTIKGTRRKEFLEAHMQELEST